MTCGFRPGDCHPLYRDFLRSQGAGHKLLGEFGGFGFGVPVVFAAEEGGGQEGLGLGGGELVGPGDAGGGACAGAGGVGFGVVGGFLVGGVVPVVPADVG